MKIRFYKYQGTGNDFILFDNRNRQISRENHTWFAQICDRRFGIGADGVMLLENISGYDFEMVYFNSDGQQSSMCGNGGRCMISFARLLGIDKPHYLFLAVDGIHEAEPVDGIIRLKMQDVHAVETGNGYYTLNTGSPHYVTFVQGLKSMDVKSAGAEIRYSERYRKEGININFIEERDGRYFIRTYERGVEDETLSCGTGVTASALVIALRRNFPAGQHQVNLETMGGTLTVAFNLVSDNNFTDIWLIGPGAFVFEGEIDYPG